MTYKVKISGLIGEQQKFAIKLLYVIQFRVDAKFYKYIKFNNLFINENKASIPFYTYLNYLNLKLD